MGAGERHKRRPYRSPGREPVAFRFREGKIVWMLATDRLDTALEAVGLRE